MSESGQERSEAPTPRRRQQARKKGTVTKSQDLVSALVVAAMLVTLPSVISKCGETMSAGFRSGMNNIPTDVSMPSLTSYFSTVATGPILAISVLIGTIMAVGVAANFAQVGFVMSAERLVPSWAKMNPLQGFKRLFSFTATFEGIKAFGKSLVFLYLGYGVVASNWDRLIGTYGLSSMNSVGIIGDLMRVLSTRIAVAWLALAILDYAFQRKQVEKQLKMTKEEVKQEFKESETSPELKAAMARRRRSISKGRLQDAIKNADVVVTNPTHYAVVLAYKPGQMHAPQVLYKGQDLIAAKIRELAKESKIPIVPNPPLARQLYKKCEIGDFVPREMFQAVAEVLAFVYRTMDEMKSTNAQRPA
ncbi:MAG: EscU/YscU/HrcU family type III secretion system export apparatus switch protein [Fimbriimonadaceae bacterium]